MPPSRDFGETQSPLSEVAPLPLARIDDSYIMGLAAAEGIGKNLAKGFHLAWETDPEGVQKAKSLDVGYLDSETVAVAIAAAQRPDGRPVRGIHCGALHRLAASRLATIQAREAPGAAPPAAVTQATTVDNDSRRCASVTDQVDK